MIVARWDPAYWLRFFEGCDPVATVNNGLGLHNQEQGVDVVVCSGLREPWATMWPALRHYD